MSCDQAKQLWGLALSQPHREVLRAYIDCMEADGFSRPPVRDIAWMTDYNERHIQRITRALEAAGLLIAYPRRGKTTEYQINLSAGTAKPAIDSGVAIVTPDTQIAPQVGGDIPNGVTLDSRGDIARGAIQIAPLDACAQQQDLKAFNTELKDQELKNKDKNTAATADAREALPTHSIQVAVPPIPVPQTLSPSDESLPEPAPIYAFYVDNMRQQVTGIIKDKLVDWIKDVGEQWVRDAIVEAVTHNVPTWAYVEACLESWLKFGRDIPRPSLVKGAGLKRPTTKVAVTASVSLGAPTIRGK